MPWPHVQAGLPRFRADVHICAVDKVILSARCCAGRLASAGFLGNIPAAPAEMARTGGDWKRSGTRQRQQPYRMSITGRRQNEKSAPSINEAKGEWNDQRD